MRQLRKNAFKIKLFNMKRKLIKDEGLYRFANTY